MSDIIEYETNFTIEWLKRLLQGMDSYGTEDKKMIFEDCAAYHYQSNHMEEMVKKYKGDIRGFIPILEKEWGWKVNILEDENTIIIDENKDICVCPVAHTIKEPIPKSLCCCSEYFIKKMFSEVVGKEIQAKVIRSLIRDGKSCRYEIKI